MTPTQPTHTPLGPGDVLQQGDEWLSGTEWLPIPDAAIGDRIDSASIHSYRRPVPAQTQKQTREEDNDANAGFIDADRAEEEKRIDKAFDEAWERAGKRAPVPSEGAGETPTPLTDTPWIGAIPSLYDGGHRGLDWHFGPYTERLLKMPLTQICKCGCERQCHGHYLGCLGLSNCSSNKHRCTRFIPAIDEQDDPFRMPPLERELQVAKQEIETLKRAKHKAEEGRDAAIKALSEASRECGLAEGKLGASELAASTEADLRDGMEKRCVHEIKLREKAEAELKEIIHHHKTYVQEIREIGEKLDIPKGSWSIQLPRFVSDAVDALSAELSRVKEERDNLKMVVIEENRSKNVAVNKWVGRLNKVEAELASLRLLGCAGTDFVEREEAGRDTARLDWLEKSFPDNITLAGSTWAWSHKDIRAAIDAASATIPIES